MALAMAQSPAVLDGYMSLSVALIKGRLGKRLGEELALTLAGTNRCEYCASAHSATGKLAGLKGTDVAAALQGKAEDAGEAAALKFASAVVEKRGRTECFGNETKIPTGPANAREPQPSTLEARSQRSSNRSELSPPTGLLFFSVNRRFSTRIELQLASIPPGPTATYLMEAQKTIPNQSNARSHVSLRISAIAFSPIHFLARGA